MQPEQHDESQKQPEKQIDQNPHQRGVSNNHQEIQHLQQENNISIPVLPNEYLHYSAPFKQLYLTKSLFKVLFVEWNVCLTCVLKIYGIQHPRLYSDSEFLAFLVKQMLKGSISEEQLFSKRYCPQNQILDVKFCWLCEQLLQKGYLKKMTTQILDLIKERKYTNYKKFKLNIRVPLIFTLKYYLFCHFVWHMFREANSSENLNAEMGSRQVQLQGYKLSAQTSEAGKKQLQLIESVLSTPYDKLDPKHSYTSILQMKVIQKWLISYDLNTNTEMQSTIEQLQDMVTINIEHDYRNHQLENNLMQLFNHMIGLEKKQVWRGDEGKSKGKWGWGQKASKKVKIDLGQAGQQPQEEKVENNKGKQPQTVPSGDLGVNLKQEEFKCIANNVSKIIFLKFNDIKHILEKITGKQNFMKFLEPLKEPPTIKAPLVNSLFSISRSIKAQTKHVYFCGKYCKYSRFISQTPWLVNSIKLTDGSLSEEIQDRIVHHFYPGIDRAQIETKFHSGGREDIDVRMLTGGRPFVLELVNPVLRLADFTLQKIIAESKVPKETQKRILAQLSAKENESQGGMKEAQKITFFFQKSINYTTQLVQVHNVLPTTESYISVQLKKAESQKIKHYVCYIISEEPLTPEDKVTVEKIKNLEVIQKTPIRVMHRRTVMSRSKMVHKIYMHQVSKFSAVVELWGSAGTYIKEFIHGDLGRTVPNLGSILGGKKCDILQLDVGSLKEGDWDENDLENMKLKPMGWMDQQQEEQKQMLGKKQ